jgi:DNA-directed RNA polymerase subunit RPC12/RpoP
MAIQAIRCGKCGGMNAANNDLCGNCRAPLGANAAGTACPKCSGERVLVEQRPQKTASVLVAVVGVLALLFGIFVAAGIVAIPVGIGLLLWAAALEYKKIRQWHCRRCGTVFPV